MTTRRPKLHLVHSAGDASRGADEPLFGPEAQPAGDPLFADLPSKKAEPPCPARFPRQSKLFVPVLVEWLSDRYYDLVFPPRTRLYLLLLCKSRSGRRPVRLTNVMLTEIGLTRYYKSRALRGLAEGGLVSVEWNGRAAPVVTVLVHGAVR